MPQTFREFEQSMVERYGPAFVARLKRNLLVLVPGLPILNFLFTSMSLGALWVALPVAIAYSWISAHFRFTGFVSGLTFMVAEFVLLVIAGEANVFNGSVQGLMLMIGAVLFFGIGVALGLSEESRIQDGF